MKFNILMITLLLSVVFETNAAENTNQNTNQDTSKNADQILTEVREGLTSLSADFEQYEINANQQKSETSKGQVWLKAPNKFKWHYLTPVEQLIIADGKQVWIYDEDLEQVTIKNQNSNNNPIYVLLNKELTEKNYQIKLIDHKSHSLDDQLHWISMQPKIANDEIKNVILGIKDKQLSVLKLENQMDNHVIFEFDHILKNPGLADDFFTFNVPEGVDVLRDTSEIGEF